MKKIICVLFALLLFSGCTKRDGELLRQNIAGGFVMTVEFAVGGVDYSGEYTRLGHGDATLAITAPHRLLGYTFEQSGGALSIGFMGHRAQLSRYALGDDCVFFVLNGVFSAAALAREGTVSADGTVCTQLGAARLYSDSGIPMLIEAPNITIKITSFKKM